MLAHACLARRPALAALAALALAAPAAAQAVELKNQYQKGEVLRLRLATEQVTDMNNPMAGGEMTTKVLQEQYYDWQVLAVDAEGTATIECRITRVTAKMDNPMAGTEITFDSDQPPAAGEGPDAPGAEPTGDATLAMLGALKGQKFTFEVAADGNIRKVTGCDVLLKAMTDRAAGAAPEMPGAGGMTSELLKHQFNDAQMRDTLQAATGGLPKGPVAVGASWKTPTKMRLPVGESEVRTELTSTLEGLEGDEARIRCAGTMELKALPAAAAPAAPAAPGGEEGGMADMMKQFMKTMKIELKKGTTAGTQVFDRKGGVLKKSEIETTMEMAMAFKLPAEMGGGDDMPAMEIPVKTRSKTTLTLVSRGAATGEKF